MIATYRLQLTGAFGFVQAADRVPYLKKLGISHLYLSPVLDAATGSAHGYDVVNHTRLAASLGGDDGFAQLVAACRAHGIGIVLDLVPNHMSIADHRNAWWWDVLENGRSGRFAHAFDVDWDPPEARLKNVVLLPVLGDRLAQVLEQKEVQVQRDGARFVVAYYEHRCPVAPRTIGMLLQQAAAACGDPELGFLADAFAELPPPTALEAEPIERRHRDKEVLRGLLDALFARSPGCARAVDATVERINGTPQLLDAFLEAQNYRLAFWRNAERDLDYRRFFDINTLVGLRMEDPRVFDEAHALIGRLIARGDVHGLRVDHVDGLADPAGYLQRLRMLAPDATIHVEKILAPNEVLPAWPIDGTTGYEHGADLTALFTHPRAEAPLTALDAELTGESPGFAQLSTAARRQVLKELLGSDVNRITHTLVRLGDRYVEVRDYGRHELRDAIGAIAASFPVYRSYVVPKDKHVDAADQKVIEAAVAAARTLAPDVEPVLFDVIADLLLLKRTGALEAEFVARFQQLTPPTMAKGVEDTAFYRYTKLLALAEVGGSPDRFHLALPDFHARNQAAQAAWPLSLNATSTHDSKRSADVRARIVAASQRPERFAALARAFFPLAEVHRSSAMPEPKLVMIALQTLVGAWPLDAARLKATLEKSAREAKVHTSWVRPNADYDAALARFAQGVVGDAQIRALLDAYVLGLLPWARAISLAWVVLKSTCPGVPDFYQGTELWNCALVDPDNRQPVDFDARARAIDDDRIPALHADEVGLTKLHVIRTCLALRAARPELFDADAAYVPLLVKGAHAEAVVAFARVAGPGAAAVTLVQRWPVDDWGDTRVVLPEGTFTSHFSSRVGPRLSELFERLPVALLSSTP